MKKVITICFIFIINLCHVYAEVPIWFNGSVVLRDNQVLTGKISIEAAFDLVFFRQSETMTVIPAHKLNAVYYYDSIQNINKRFTVIQQKEQHFIINQIYEVVVSGEVSVLRRLRSAKSNQDDDAEGYQYFVRYNDDTMDIGKFRQRLFQPLTVACSTLSTYITNNKLNPIHPADAILIIAFYNKNRTTTLTVQNL